MYPGGESKGREGAVTKSLCRKRCVTEEIWRRETKGSTGENVQLQFFFAPFQPACILYLSLLISYHPSSSDFISFPCHCLQRADNYRIISRLVRLQTFLKNRNSFPFLWTYVRDFIVCTSLSFLLRIFSGRRGKLRVCFANKILKRSPLFFTFFLWRKIVYVYPFFLSSR